MRYAKGYLIRDQVNSPEFFAYTGFLMSFPWEWFVTLAFPIEENAGPVKTKMRRLWFTRKLCTVERIQVGYFYVEAAQGNFSHIHMLMLGRRIRYGFTKTLDLVSRSFWESFWKHQTKVEKPVSISSLATYCVAHIHNPKYDWVDDGFYNLKLLKKCKMGSFK
ncbi:hypothetical protein LCGC14_1989060 [marine sediment metagenome]|uniref:Uncharacterized protein n=1 Tax=marine sediment metagenome TaxID=412755 RepID=A0A0F9F6U3_9ZZZZ